ncbi:hypothetical protein [Streptomyces sp. NBC_01296]|uniref:hypothetical protein n=1 Tax=Streptomyces sp. NBC_01296 TaxID=2903816 RepID=UPI002E1030E4|nr:hypothetical protein OG299_00410 [Streptomyces sp. NBC_01296]
MAKPTDAFITLPGGQRIEVSVGDAGDVRLPKNYAVVDATRVRALERPSRLRSVAGRATVPAKSIALRYKPAASAYQPKQALERVLGVLGNNGAAALLGVSSSQPTRWKSGRERMSPASVSAVVNLDAFLSLLFTVFTPEQAELWLSGQEPLLGGARPADVFRSKGLAALAPILQAIEQGAYA